MSDFEFPLRTLSFEGLRGVARARLDPLGDLNILVGPNNTGKSTILEAAYLLAGACLPGALSSVLRWRGRAGPSADDVRYLFRQGVRQAGQLADVAGVHGGNAAFTLALVEVPPGSHGVRVAAAAAGEPDDRTMEWTVFFLHTDLPRGGYSQGAIFDRIGLPVPALLLGPGAWGVGDLEALLSEAKQEGRGAWPLGIVRAYDPTAVDLEILKTRSGDYAVFVQLEDRAVPLDSFGGGMTAAVRMALALRAIPSGLLLVEEPETHQHPAGLIAVARVLVEAAHTGLQVFATTHSLELLDRTLEDAKELGMGPDRVRVIRTALVDGELQVRNWPADEAERLLDEIGLDLRGPVPPLHLPRVESGLTR